jgi:hypothetical protein
MGLDLDGWAFRDLREYLGLSKTIREATSILPDDQARDWFKRLEALDNLLLLYGLRRHETVHGGGFVIYHPSAPNIARWIDLLSSEESWVEDVLLLAR